MSDKSTMFQIGVVAAFGGIVGVVCGFLLATGLTRPPVEPAAPVATQAQVLVPTVDTGKIADEVAARVTPRVLEQVKAMIEEHAKAQPAEPPKAVEPAAPAAPDEPPKAVEPPPRPPVRHPPEPAPAPTPAPTGEWRKAYSTYKTAAGLSPAIGPQDALVRVFIISDFQCPVCRRAAEGLEQIFDQFAGKVQWIFWQNPLDMHRRAMAMAKAAAAAAGQGKFWEYHDLMFKDQGANDEAALIAHAKQLGLDIAKFQADLNSADLEKKIRSDQAAAELMEARGTPAFVINGKLQVGWGSEAGIASMVARELEIMEKLVGSGISVADAMTQRAQGNADSPKVAEVYLKHFLAGEPAQRPVANPAIAP